MVLISGLKVNYDKCWLYGMNVNDQLLNKMASILDCNIGCLPISYLGIKVRIHQCKEVEWKGVVNKIKERLQRWEGNKFSLGGKITLLNSVLSLCLLTTYRSTKSKKKKTLRDIVSLQRSFLWEREVVRDTTKLIR